MSLDDEARQLRSVHDSLLREFAGRLGDDVVSAQFAAVLSSFEGAPIRTFVPVLARRQARLTLCAAE